jgi:uncharacterized protein (UPF0335 family)
MEKVKSYTKAELEKMILETQEQIDRLKQEKQEITEDVNVGRQNA